MQLWCREVLPLQRFGCVFPNSASPSANDWHGQVDEFILSTRRKSGRQTENNVIALWKVSSVPSRLLHSPLTQDGHQQRWLPGAMVSGVIPDIIVDANHTIEYLKYAATRNLFTSKGNPKDGHKRLSSVRVYAPCACCP